MEIVDRFLNALQSKINACNDQINSFDEKINQKMRLKNVLYAHELLDNEIKMDDLISFSDEEIKTIFEVLDKNKKDILYKTYHVYKPLVDMYHKIIDKYQGKFEAPQYKDALKWLNDLVSKINNYLKSTNDIDEKYITKLKEDNSINSKYYNMFNGNELVYPITDFKEFNSLLDNLNFSDKEKYQIKKFIGIGNIKLLSESYDPTTEEAFNKYITILNNKKNKYQKAYNLISEKEIDYSNIDTRLLAKELKKGEYEIRQAISVILMENTLKEVSNGLSINEAINKLEGILDFSRESTIKETPEVEESTPSLEEETNNQEETQPESKEEDQSSDRQVIINALSMINDEKELLSSIDEEKLGMYLAQSLNSDEEDLIKYQIASVLLATHAEIEKYQNIKDIEPLRAQTIDTIKEYIEAYKTLKNKK